MENEKKKIVMCIWAVPEDKRLCGFCLYRQCTNRNHPQRTPVQVGRSYAEAIRRVSGVDPLARTRKREVVWCRNMIALQMCLDGFVQNDIAEVLGLGRSSVVHCIDSMVTALDSPQIYWKEMEIWNKFREKLSLSKNK